RVVDAQLVAGSGRAAQLHGNRLLAPRRQAVVGLARLPLVHALAAAAERAAPVALGRVARAREEEHVPRFAAPAEDTGEGLVDLAAAFAVAPARHDDGTGDDPRPLLLRPADRLQKLLRPVGLPVGEEQLGLRGEGVHDLAAQDSVLAVLGLQVAVGPERA